MKKLVATLVLSFFLAGGVQAQEALKTDKPCFSGIFPHLAYFNNEGECGTGAIVPWADRLWLISYGPSAWLGSSDKLYEIDSKLNVVVRPESVGGTHANRLIHKESQQLIIGYYLIDEDRKVRVIAPKNMPGRITGIARHLTDPANKVYYASMEEGFYEVDVNSLDVKVLNPDGHALSELGNPLLPGAHGKGFYSGQGRVIYSNNANYKTTEYTNAGYPRVGCLATWDGKDWTAVLRNQFTEVTGPGGIEGNEDPESDVVWSIGWDHRSLILVVLDGGKWTKFRLPKASNCYDGTHGCYTEWPRIREINEGDNYLMTMHGTFWKFPKAFSALKARGIRPRSTYLKVIGDFCYWRGKLLLGCDDTAHRFASKSPFKGNIAAPGQSNSNIWVIDPARLDNLGIPFGNGAVWSEEPVEGDAWSDPYLFAGYDRRGVCLSHDAEHEVEFTFEVDLSGDGNWTPYNRIRVSGTQWIEFSPQDKGEWIRVKASRDLNRASCCFQYKNADNRPAAADAIFDGIAKPDCKDYLGGMIWVRGDNQSLAVVSQLVKDNEVAEEGYYEMGADSKLVKPQRTHKDGETGTIGRIKEKVAVSELGERTYAVDDASVILGQGNLRYRLPFGCEQVVRRKTALPLRLNREVVTERDLLHCAGTFYELPKDNAGQQKGGPAGLRLIRPVATDGRLISDYGSYRGLLILMGIDMAAIAGDGPAESPHIVKSEDGKAALWAGCIDDLWKIGKAVGHGATWKNTAVRANEASLPYLMNGFDKKSMTLTNHFGPAAAVTIEVDISGAGVWKTYRIFDVAADDKVEYDFPHAFQAYWVRTTSNANAILSAEFLYK